MSKEQNQKIIIFSAPSGAGKSTIVKYLLDKGLPLAFSISATTRAPRGAEVHGKDYYFLGENEFKARVANEEFVEWEEVYEGLLYGSLKSELVRIWNEGQTVLYDIDVQGGMRLKEIFGSKALSIFVQPPSILVLEDRLKARGTDTEEQIQTRMAKAYHEMMVASEFDQVILNDDLETACKLAHRAVSDFIEK